MTAREYSELLERVQHLKPEEQLRLVADLAIRARRRLARRRRRSIMELQGLGKQVWRGVEAQAYVDRERASWSG